MRTDVDKTVKAVLNGDVEAFAELVRRYQQDVWRVVAAMLYDKKRTEDLVQQAFVNAYTHLQQYGIGRDFLLWLKSIARNVVRQELRRSSREDNKLRTYHAELTVQMADDTKATDRRAAMSEALQRCREQLPANAKQALELRYDEAADFSEISERLGRTLAATRQFLSRVRVTLRMCIEKELVQA